METPQKIRKLLLVFGIVIALLMLISFATKAYSKYALRHTASSFVNDILANNSQASYKDFTPDAQKDTDSELWHYEVQSWSEFFTQERPTYKQTTVLKNQGYTLVDYSILGRDGRYTFEVTLVSAGAGYKVQSFTSTLN